LIEEVRISMKKWTLEICIRCSVFCTLNLLNLLALSDNTLNVKGVHNVRQIRIYAGFNRIKA
jgi:hypothetical protein